MVTRGRVVLGTVLAMVVLGEVAGAVEFPKIDRRPQAAEWERGRLRELKRYDPNSRESFQVDLRCYDASGLDLRDRLADLLHADFDDRTKWPEAERMPEGFDYKRIMELGKNPGLGVRDLHERGITGRGIGIAILDQPLIIDHVEYGHRIRLYEEINIEKGMEAQMHGPAVASIAVGKTVGVAPEADLYYIAQFNGDFGDGDSFTWNFEYLARAVLRVLEVNGQLPQEKKIRVISMSVGWHPSQKGYQQIAEATRKAKEAGMLVICSSVEEVHGFAFHGLGRPVTANPDDFNVYGPGSWWAGMFYEGSPFHSQSNRLLVPMDARTTAGPTGKDEYVFYAQGGWSWSIPYIAGMYALAAQAEPKITPQRFWALAMRTGRTIQLRHKDKDLEFGPILDPAQLIEAIQRGDLSDEAAVTAEMEKHRSRMAPAMPQGPIPKEFSDKLARLDIDDATRMDVIERLGKPASYIRGNQVLDVNSLPEIYAMVYPAGFQVIIAKDRVHRISVLAPGFLFRDKIQVGSSLEEVFDVLGPPDKTVEGAKGADVSTRGPDKLFYKDIDGVSGQCVYRAQAQGVALWFSDNRVSQMMLLPRQPPTQ